MSNDVVKRNRKSTIRLFLSVFIVAFILASLMSLYSEMVVRQISLSDEVLKYSDYDQEAKAYIFLDSQGKPIPFKGDYGDPKASKSMTYNGSLYQLRVDSRLLYVFYKDGEIVEDYSKYQLNIDALREQNEEAYILNEAFKIISLVEKKHIYKVIIFQFILIIITTAMLVNPNHFRKFGYFRSNSRKEFSKNALRVVRFESLVITTFIVLFPLIRCIK